MVYVILNHNKPEGLYLASNEQEALRAYWRDKGASSKRSVLAKPISALRSLSVGEFTWNLFEGEIRRFLGVSTPGLVRVVDLQNRTLATWDSRGMLTTNAS